MTLQEFISTVPNFAALSHPEKIKHFGWFLHVHQQQERFNQGAIRKCYVAMHVEAPNLTKEFGRLMDRNPRQLLRDNDGFRLELNARRELDKKYAKNPTTIVISSLLKELPGKISDEAESLFLSEALKCYTVGAFRSAIVMTWNLAYDHLLRWILSDPKRLAAFNAGIVISLGAKRGTGITVAKRTDFEDLKESDVIAICGTAGLFESDNTKKVLNVQLTKRNLAAHPSLIVIGVPQADDTISDLVNNVVLKLA